MGRRNLEKDCEAYCKASLELCTFVIIDRSIHLTCLAVRIGTPEVASVAEHTGQCEPIPKTSIADKNTKGSTVFQANVNLRYEIRNRSLFRQI